MIELTQHHLPTVCPLDCPDTCSLSVTVKNDRVTSIRGSKANPLTDGAICSKVAKYYPDYVHGEQRLRYPMRRVGKRGSGEFERISWEQALDQIYQAFSETQVRYGAASLLGFNYAGPHGELAMASLDRRFFNVLGATQLNRSPLCGGVRSGAYSSMFGDAPGMPPEQVLQSDMIIIWGNNATVSNLHLARLARKAQAQGAKLVVIDPKRITVADRADLFIQIKPGTDVVLGLALAAELERRDALDRDFMAQWVMGSTEYLQHARQYSAEDAADICGISLASFHAFADLYQQSQCACLSVGVGMERNRHGGSGIRAAMALQALTGNFGQQGAGIMLKQSAILPKQETALTRNDLLPVGTREINILDVPHYVLEDEEQPIRAMLIYNHNPLVTHPDQERMRAALSRDDVFIAGCDVVMTDSMNYCDVVLPAASVFEIEDIYVAYGHNYLQRAEAVIPLVGEALPNTEIFRRLAQRFGMDDVLFQLSDKALMDEGFDVDDPRLQGIKPSELPLDQALLINTADNQPVVMCQSVQPATPSGKITLFSEDLQVKYGYGLPRYEVIPSTSASTTYPFTLISPSSNERTNTTFGGCMASLQVQVLEIHPDDAAQHGIEQGDEVRVWNAQGEVFFRAEISDCMRPGVVYTPKGAWLATSRSGQTVNALISVVARTDIMDGACYNDTFVTLARA